MAYDIGPRIGIQGEKEFNNQIRAINNSLKEYGSELKALSSKFEENADSQEALASKTKVLQKQYDAQSNKLDILQKQYDKEVKKLKELADEYNKVSTESGKNSIAAAKAETAFNKQAETVSKLKVSMNETEGYASKLRTAIDKNTTALKEMEDGTRDAVTGLSKLDDEAENAGDSFDDMSKKLDAGNLMNVADTFAQMGDAIAGAVEESKEFIAITSQMEVAAESLGYTSEETNETFKQLYGILGDEQASATTVSNLQAMQLSQEQLTKLTEASIGAWARYGDSIPIDGLAEAVNESTKVSQVTGVLADALNWAGVNEDEFNTKLKNATTEQERQQLIVETLSGLYGGLAEEYRENNEALIESNEANLEFKENMAEIAEKILPMLTTVTETVNSLVGLFLELPEPAQGALVGIMGLFAVLSSIAPVITAVGTAMSIFGASGTAAAVGTTAAGTAATGAAAGAGLLTSTLLPMVAGIAAVVAVIAAVVAVIKNWDQIMDYVKEKFGPIFDDIKDGFTDMCDNIGEAKDNAVNNIIELRDNAEEKFNSIKDSINTKLSEASASAKNKFDEIKSAASEKIGNARDKIKEGIQDIKKRFTDAKFKFPSISIPKISLPKFTISGKFSLNPLQVPKFSVKWNKDGAILSGAQLFGRIGNMFLGGGEAGKEAVLPLTSFYERLQLILDKILNPKTDYSNVLQVNVQVVNHVYIGNKKVANEVADTVVKKITAGQQGKSIAKGEVVYV